MLWRGLQDRRLPDARLIGADFLACSASGAVRVCNCNWVRSLYVQVLLAFGAAIVLGSLAPAWAQAFKPMGDGFI